MSVSKSSIKSPLQGLFEIDEQSKALIVKLGQQNHSDEILYARCREQISRLMEQGDFEEIVFDLSDLLVLPSSALGLIAAVSQGGASVRVINPSDSAREDFEMTGLCRLIELEPEFNPPPK